MREFFKFENFGMFAMVFSLGAAGAAIWVVLFGL